MQPIQFRLQQPPLKSFAAIIPSTPQGWSVKNLPGLNIWLEADPTTLYTDAGTTLVSADGQLIQQWNDKSGNTKNASQATAGQRPLYKTGSGAPYIQFDGVDDQMDTASVVQTDGSGQHWLAVAVYLDTTSGNQGFATITGNVSQHWIGGGTSAIRSYDNAASSTDDLGPTVAATTPFVYIATVTSTAAEVFADNVSNGATALAGTRASSAGVFSVGGGLGFIQGRVYAVIQGKGLLSVADRLQLQDYLTAKMVASTTPIGGTLSKTLGALTLSSTGGLAIQATLAKTLGVMTLSSNAKLLINGTLNKTLGVLTLSSAAKVLIKGTLSKTLGATTLSSTSKLALNGTLSKTLGILTLSSNAKLLIKGTLSKILGVSALTSQGGVRITGSLNKTLGVLTGTETGVLLIKGSLTQSLRPLTSAASGRLSIQGTVNTTLSRLSGTETGVLLIKGSLSKTLSPTTLSSSGYSSTNISGTLSITLEGLTCSITSMGVKPVIYRPGTRFSRSIMEQIRKSRQPIPRTTSGRIRQ